MKSLIIDASSAILLFKGGLFTVLLHHYDVLCVERVFTELTRPGYPGSDTFARLQQEGNFKVIQPPQNALGAQLAIPASARLHSGERDTLVAFPHTGAEFILTDDGGAAAFCRRARLPYTCALLIPRILRHAGLISAAACSAYTADILAAGRYAPPVVAYASGCPTQDLAFFAPGSDRP